MSYFPDARTGENGYKDTDLKGERAAFLKGFDCAVDEIKNLFNGNLEMYSVDSLVIHYIAKHEEEAKEILECIEEFMEMSRNETTVCLLDDQYCEEEDEEDVE